MVMSDLMAAHMVQNNINDTPHSKIYMVKYNINSSPHDTQHMVQYNINVSLHGSVIYQYQSTW